jgi:hypothetical protein
MNETRPEFYTALHHAGHAVVAHIVELPFGHVSLERDDTNLASLLHGDAPASNWNGDALSRLGTVSVAGRVALEIYAGAVPDDFSLDPADRWVTAADLEMQRTRAREILTACWPAVTAIADMLITRERVTAADVQSTVRSTVPGMEKPVPYVESGGASAVRRPSGAADSEDSADALPEGALAGGVDEGGGD